MCLGNVLYYQYIASVLHDWTLHGPVLLDMFGYNHYFLAVLSLCMFYGSFHKYPLIALAHVDILLVRTCAKQMQL